MTADTLKTTRVLELYQDFLSGKLINKQQAAEQYHVNVRSIQRDIDSIRDFLSEQCAKEGIVRKIEYDKKENGYRLVTQEIEQLSKGEVLALCKILLESRAFTKEQVEKQLQIILNLCVSQKEKSDIEWFISNELFHYHDPAHATVDPDNLWMVAQAIRNQSVLEIEYAYEEKGVTDQYRKAINEYWAQTETAFDQAAEQLDQAWTAYVERLQTTVDSYDIEQIETSLTAAKGIQNFFEHIPL